MVAVIFGSSLVGGSTDRARAAVTWSAVTESPIPVDTGRTAAILPLTGPDAAARRAPALPAARLERRPPPGRSKSSDRAIPAGPPGWRRPDDPLAGFGRSALPQVTLSQRTGKRGIIPPHAMAPHSS